MSKILILYHSNSGNTAKMAQEVAVGAQQVVGAEVRLVSIDEATSSDLDWCEGIALGSPTNYGTVSWQMKKWWDEQPIENWGKRDGRIGCAFSSAASWGGGQELTCMTLNAILMNYGYLVFGVTDLTGPQHTLHYGAIQAGEPRQEKEIAGCRRLGRRLAEWVAVFFHGRKDLHPLEQEYDRFGHLK
ncbi:flavodoxin family protein [Blastopirellula sp. JC732]|uniref:Flavodoxin family protein n=1 Tax=Blastopirellula sediminis TaxID=2894196 RepID=A0A9X1MMS3_9BACT|nr:flavodoxin family protein [Blastopirellula sediminis]MCC9607545.1 flavodoxin family protein [Blastopirellula sediminis]MCC9629162.1 flavodoxin family protein [Blastopirellula sediminis]